jgi:adenylate cyclase
MSQAKSPLDLKAVWKNLKKGIPVLLICAFLNILMLGFLWAHYTGRLGSAGSVLVTLENKLLDMRFVLRGVQKPNGKIGILAMDERSIQKFGRWPFTRSVYENAFINLKKAGVSWIGFDVVWDKPERPLLADAMPDITQIKDGGKNKGEAWTRIQKMTSAGLADQAILRTMTNYEKVVQGYMYYGPHETDSIKSLNGLGFKALDAMQGSVIFAAIMPDGFDINKYPDLAIGAVVGNTEAIAGSTPHFGFFNNDPDEDSVVRWVNLVKSANGSLLPSMSLKMAASMTGRDIVVVFDKMGVEEIMLVNADNDKDVIKIPVDPSGQGKALLNHLGPSMTLKHISLADAYDDKFTAKERATLKGMSLMMGPTAMAINDMRANPFEPTFNGVEHHATMIDNIVGKKFFKRPADIYRLEMMVVLILGIFFSVMLSSTSALMSAVGVVFFYVGYFYLDRYLWFNKGIWVYMGMPYIQITGLFMTVTLYKYFTEEREKKKVKGAFQHYLSPDVMHQVLDNPEKLKLGGERRECTVFFSDVRGFTTISEALSPEKLVELMNDYLSPMTEVILRSGGVLDKYIGDAIMAFWGAPLDRPDQADVAARSVLLMMEKLEELRRVFPTKGFPVIDIGCGINTGMMSVGNMGSSERFAYTVMGDSVNLAARLESITKEYGVRIIFSEFAVAKLQDRNAYFLRDLDDIVVKGKKDPVKIYELIHPMILPNETALRNLLGEFSEARTAYRAQDWAKVKKHLNSCLMIRPDDGPTRMFFDRVEELEKLPFVENWDGVHVFKHK